MIKKVRVYLTLKPIEAAAREVAENVLFRANPHDSSLVEKNLRVAGITVENLQKYFMELSKVVTQFWNNNWDPSVRLALQPHEIRSLYLPLMYGVIFASVGNMTAGSYEYLLKSDETTTVDKNFLLEFSATLEAHREYVKGATAQIGNRRAEPQTSVMMSILAETFDSRSTEINTRDGVNVDLALAGLGALAGLSLVEEATRILYTGVEEVNFRSVTETLIEKSIVKPGSKHSENVDDTE